MKFDSYHPAINLIYFSAALICIVCFNHPVYIGISYISAFAYSVKLNGKRGLLFCLSLIPLAILYAFIYAYYNHFGVTVLGENVIGNSMTLEAFVYGLAIGSAVVSALMMISCMLKIFSSDKVVYLFGRISPKLSLFISIFLRAVPRIKLRAGKVNTARCGIGRGISQGGVYGRLVNCVRMISSLITWTLENFVESSASMKSRGYSLRGRTAFSIYRFDNRDRSFVLTIFVCLTITLMAIIFNQTDIYYNPEIVFNRITPISSVFYAAYAIFMMLPLCLQITGEIRFRKLSSLSEGNIGHGNETV